MQFSSSYTWTGTVCKRSLFHLVGHQRSLLLTPDDYDADNGGHIPYWILTHCCTVEYCRTDRVLHHYCSYFTGGLKSNPSLPRTCALDLTFITSLLVPTMLLASIVNKPRLCDCGRMIWSPSIEGKRGHRAQSGFSAALARKLATFEIDVETALKDAILDQWKNFFDLEETSSPWNHHENKKRRWAALQSSHQPPLSRNAVNLFSFGESATPNQVPDMLLVFSVVKRPLSQGIALVAVLNFPAVPVSSTSSYHCVRLVFCHKREVGRLPQLEDLTKNSNVMAMRRQENVKMELSLLLEETHRQNA